MLLEVLQQISAIATMHAKPEGEAVVPKNSTGESALCLICGIRTRTRYCNASFTAARGNVCAGIVCRQECACVFMPGFVLHRDIMSSFACYMTSHVLSSNATNSISCSLVKVLISVLLRDAWRIIPSRWVEVNQLRLSSIRQAGFSRTC